MDRISRTDGSAFTRRGESWFEVTQLGPTEFRVRLGGTFHGAWLASLTRRLAEHHLSIDHTHARLTGVDMWLGELHLLCLPGAADPLSLDYAALAEAVDSARAPEFVLSSFRTIESRDYGGSLMVSLEAPDTLGLLGALLSTFAALSLYPVELHIETRDGRAYDSLWLRAGTASGAPARPSDDTRDAVARLLDRSLSPRS